MIKERESNFELLRIILMIMVLNLHYLGKPLGGALDIKNIPSSDFNYYLARFIESFSIIAVNCYIIITGYFMHSKKEVKYKRILELVLTYFFYLFLIMGLVILFEPKLFDISIFKDAIFFKNSGAWFILTYTILYILIPYINILINSISKKQFITLLLILLSCFCILPTFFGFKSVIDNGYGITMFVCLYLVGAFIGKYKINKHPASLYFFIFMFSQLITFTNFLDNRFFGTLTYNSIFNVIGAISFFLLFSKIKIKSKLINKISISVFSVFIIHMNTFISKYIWTEIFNCTNYYTSKLFIVNLVFSVVTVFIACILIDFLRIKLFSFIEKLFVGKEKNV